MQPVYIVALCKWYVALRMNEFLNLGCLHLLGLISQV